MKEIKVDPYYVWLMVQGGGYSDEVRKKVENNPLVKESLQKRWGNS